MTPRGGNHPPPSSSQVLEVDKFYGKAQIKSDVCGRKKKEVALRFFDRLNW